MVYDFWFNNTTVLHLAERMHRDFFSAIRAMNMLNLSPSSSAVNGIEAWRVARVNAVSS
jgi:hypothetical protein